MSPEARAGAAGNWRSFPPLVRQFVRLTRHQRAVSAEVRRPARFRDPVTGDELTLAEEASWKMQGIIRRWTFVVVVTLLTIAVWTYVGVSAGWSLRSGALADLTWWNLSASYLAILIESTVGIAMFSQTRRDAVKIRKIEAIAESQAALMTLICSHLGIEVTDSKPPV